MSQISLKSISGITSITTPAGVDNVFTVHSNDTTERFRVDLNGNQSIAGILTVAQDLDVDGHTNLDNVSIAGISSTGNIYITTGGDGRKLSFAGDGSSHYIKMDHTLNGPIINGYGGIAFETNGTNERLRITSSGHVNIGGASPASSALCVKMDTNKHIGFSPVQSEVGNVPALVAFQDNGSLNSIGFRGSDIRFATGSAERLRIDGDGIITQSTTHPQIILKDPANRQVSLRSPSTSNLAALGTDSSHALIFYTNGYSNERLRITSDGKIGFGTNSPDQTVHIHKGSAGTIDSTATSVLTLENSTSAVLQFLTPNNVSAQLRFGDPQDNGAGFIDYSHTSNTMAFGANGPTRMQLDGNGHLGIDVASVTQLANSKILTIRPTDDDGIRFVRPGDTNNSPNVHLDLTTTTSGSSLRSGGEAYTTKYHTYNCDMLFRSYLGGGTGGIIRFVTSDGSGGTQRYWQMDEDGMTTHRSRSSTAKTHEFSYTGGAGGGTLNVDLLSISGYVASSTAVAEIKYVGMYGLAGSYISQGIWLCSYRRANGGSAANALAQQTHNGGSNSASNVTMAWVGDNLRLTVGAFTGFTVHVTVTVYNATINVLV